MTFRKLWYVISVIALIGIIVTSLVVTRINPTKQVYELFIPTTTPETTNPDIHFQLKLPEDASLFHLEDGLHFSQLPSSPTIIFQENKVIARLAYNQIGPAPEKKKVSENLAPYLTSDKYVVFALTGEQFTTNTPDNYSIATVYTYENALKPILDELAAFVEQSHIQVTYQIDILYSSDSETMANGLKIPSGFEIQAFSEDSGASVNFHIIIYNKAEP